jgi:glutamate-1-semialdehyde 2,1-aminomutase
MNWTRSKELLERARLSLAGGVSSPFRAKAPVPLYFQDACGCRLTDVDGNTYIDYTLAWGPVILGHRHPRMVEAVAAQARAAHIYGAQHEDEIVVAERMQAMVPCAERVLFTGAGSEALQIAWRLARGFTGRNRVLKFEGHYHGWMDSVLISYKPSAGAVGSSVAPNAVLASAGQTPNVADNVHIAIWNSVEAVDRVFAEHGSEIAAVVMEPVLCNSGCILPKDGYLAAVRDIAHRHGALLIFDEVITGFRMAPGGAQQVYGVIPDLATFGKAIAAGLPLSAIGGRRDILEQTATGKVSFGGTFNGNPLSLAGARVALEELSRDDGAALKQANAMGAALRDGIQEAARKRGIPCLVSGFGAAFAVHFTERTELVEYRDTLDDDPAALRRFLLCLMEEGVNAIPDGRFYTSAAHQEGDIELSIKAAERALERMNAA